MRNVDNGGSAFPVVADVTGEVLCDGMTLRDYFAAEAMNSLVMRGDWFVIHDETQDPLRTEAEDAQGARMAYRIADAMIAARDK